MKFNLIRLRANIMLFVTAFIWGVTFVAQKSAMDFLGPFMFNGLRCLFGSLSLFLLSLVIKHGKISNKPSKNRKNLVEGSIIAGVLLFLATTLQQIGIVDSTAGKAGFITSLYIVLVPLFSLISGKRVTRYVWIGVILALIGLYLLCVNGAFGIGKGDLIILFSAVFFTLHIMCISKYAKKVDSIKLSCLQFFFAGIFATILGLIFEQTKITDIYNCLKELFYAGVLSCAVAYTLQIKAQKNVRPYIASLILSLESVFAVLAGFLILNETLTIKEATGCVLMFMAVFVAQFHSKSSNKT